MPSNTGIILIVELTAITSSTQNIEIRRKVEKFSAAAVQTELWGLVWVAKETKGGENQSSTKHSPIFKENFQNSMHLFGLYKQLC